MIDPIDEREQIIERLRAAGVTEDALREADDEGRLPTLAVELAMGGPERFTLTHVAREAGLSTAFTREFMQAVGRPDPAPRERVYTSEDVDFARVVARYIDAGLPRDGLLEVARVMSLGMSNAAEAVRRLAGDAMLKPGDSEYAVGLRYAQTADRLLPDLARQLDHQFRAHLRAGVRRQLVTEAEREAGRLAGTRDVAVAFADLVGYTKLGEKLAPEDVGRIAGRLTELAARSVRPPVQLVKTIGDAAMFVSPEPDALIDAMVRLTRGIEAEGEDFPSVRVGMAFGPATTRGGDWFGATVNVASRVTGTAKPGSLFATEALHAASGERPWKRKRKRGLRGVDGRTRLYALDAKRLSELAG